MATFSSSLLLLGLLAILSYAECKCGPDQFEDVQVGKIATASTASTPGKTYRITVRRSYDLTRMMEVYQEVLTDPSFSVKYNVYRDYKQRTQYVAYLDTKTCKKSVLNDKMQRICDDNDQLNRTASFKVGGSVADVYDFSGSGYSGSVVALRNSLRVIGTLVTGNFDGVNSMSAYNVGNFTAGIRDASVFKVPDYCTNSLNVIG